MKQIMHVDINSYFATLLQQENPYLRGKPVGVVKDQGRTCVIAASKEAKKKGVKTGCNSFEARTKAPGIIFVPAEFDMYLDATRKLKQIFITISPEVTIYSLDEAFIDISRCIDLYPSPLPLALEIQQRIKQQLGEWVTCNIGIAHSRLLAKMASEIGEKGSITVVNEEETETGSDHLWLGKSRPATTVNFIYKDILLATTRFADVCGVGLQLEQKLKAWNVEYPYQLRFLAEADLASIVSPFWAKQLLRIAYGDDPHFLTLVDHNPHMKSVSRSVTGYQLAKQASTVKRILYNLTEEVSYKVRNMHMAGRYLEIKLYGHEQSFRAHQTLQYYVRHTNEMFDLIQKKLLPQWRDPFPVIKFMVSLSHLKPMDEVPVSLLPTWHQNERLYQAMDTISAKYGLFTLYSGLLHHHKKIYPEVTGFLGDKLYWGL